ncbi:MAG TPA: LuxR C-terminal-related transcriptional regulator [Syntrophales bacterium]|nr:LuxR C-terminal-related transcriptional regulator [Syntrophales bacterium]
MSGGDRELEGKAIYITGTRHLDNKALACFLIKETGACCEALSFDEVEVLSRQVPPPEPRLFLFDALDRRIQAMIVDDQPGTNGNGPLFAGLFSRLFQEYSNGNRPGKAMNGRPCGFIYRFDQSDLFLLAVRDLLLDRKSVVEGLPALYTRPGNGQAHEEGHPLSPREFHILFMMAGGYSNKGIAARINISSHTVRTHLYNIFRKIDVGNRVQASLWVHEHVERFFCVI